ncbi:MAG: hypothetical protein HY676_00670 [Chloroflexi bacterium]|nr:hypothetical protein [Chloroflexota bacterium]
MPYNKRSGFFPALRQGVAIAKKPFFILLLGIVMMAATAAILRSYTSERAYGLDQNQCLLCHGNPDLAKTNSNSEKVSLYVKEEFLNTSAHRYIDCTACHTATPHQVDTPLTKLSLAQKCGTCHEYQYNLHKESIHGQQLLQGNADVATCVDCHSPTANPHNVIRVLEYSAPAYRKNIAETCGKCHRNETLMGRYGILEKVYETYMRSFHGKAMRLGTYEISRLDKATCTNCHGTHDIKSLEDPQSPVAGMENLARTCEQCHPDAGAKFASGFLGHKEATPQYFPGVFFTEIFFLALTSAVVALGVIVTGLAVIRWGINRWKV